MSSTFSCHPFLTFSPYVDLPSSCFHHQLAKRAHPQVSIPPELPANMRTFLPHPFRSQKRQQQQAPQTFTTLDAPLNLACAPSLPVQLTCALSSSLPSSPPPSPPRCRLHRHLRSQREILRTLTLTSAITPHPPHSIF